MILRNKKKYIYIFLYALTFNIPAGMLGIVPSYNTNFDIIKGFVEWPLAGALELVKPDLTFSDLSP